MFFEVKFCNFLPAARDVLTLLPVLLLVNAFWDIKTFVFQNYQFSVSGYECRRHCECLLASFLSNEIHYSDIVYSLIQLSLIFAPLCFFVRFWSYSSLHSTATVIRCEKEEWKFNEKQTQFEKRQIMFPSSITRSSLSWLWLETSRHSIETLLTVDIFHRLAHHLYFEGWQQRWRWNLERLRRVCSFARDGIFSAWQFSS